MRFEMNCSGLKVNVKVKEAWWYSALKSLLQFLGMVRCINTRTAVKILCKAASKGYKYKVGNGNWKSFNKEIKYEHLDDDMPPADLTKQ